MQIYKVTLTETGEPFRMYAKAFCEEGARIPLL